jgi:hypothetical protein
MTLRPLLPAILLALIMSVVVGVLATGRGSGPTLEAAVALFVLQMCFAMARVNAPFWQAAPTAPDDDLLVACIWGNAVLAALVYAWGATAMFAIYSVSGLVWRHWWQYGAAMSLFAVAILLYAALLTGGRGALRKPRALNALIALTAAQGIAMVVALAYLAFSGKLHTPRDDWAANYIFIGGSFALLLLSWTAVLSYRKLKRKRRSAR